MKRYIQCSLLSVFVCVNIVLSQKISGRFSTSAYSWERYDTVGQSNVITRVFQTVQLDGEYKDLSLHTSINGAIGSAGKFTNDGQIRIYNLYLDWKSIANLFDVRIGRIPIFAGVGNGIVDGAKLRTNLMENKITITGFGGMNVPSDLRGRSLSDLNKNIFFGGQLIGNFLDDGRISLSYMNRQRSLDGYTAKRPDADFNPILMQIQPGIRKEQIIGGDISYIFIKKYTTYGRLDYDLNSKDVLRGELDGHFDILNNFALTGTYIYRKPRIPYNSFFSIFKVEAVSEYEAGVEYSLSQNVKTFGRFAFVQYDNDNSKRYTVGINTKYGSCSYSGSDGYAGELNSFTIEGEYPLFNKQLIPTISASIANYRLDKTSSKENTYSGSVGAVVRLIKSFSFDAQVQWLKNRIVENDVRVFGRINYWFSHNFSSEKGTGE